MLSRLKNRIVQWSCIWFSVIIALSIAHYLRYPKLPRCFKKWDKLVVKKQATAFSKKNLFLLCWNIEMAYQKKKVQAALERYNADIAVLQEVPVYEEDAPPVFAERTKNSAYSPSTFTEKPLTKETFIHFGQLTLSKLSLIKAAKINLPQVCGFSFFHNRKRFGRRSCVYTKIAWNKATLGIYNVHLENFARVSGRIKQMKKIMAFMKKQKDTFTIIAGDFNTYLGTAKTLNVALKAGLQRAKARGPTCGLLTLDHILHSPNLEVKAKVHFIQGSDHFPLLAEVKPKRL